MTTYQFKDAVLDPSLLQNFDPSSDILLFTDHAAADVVVTLNEDGIFSFLVDGQGVGFAGDVRSLGAGTAGFVRFIDGSTILIGDGTIATVADDLSNKVYGLSTAGDDLIFGLGGNDSLDGGLGHDLIYGNAGHDIIAAEVGLVYGLINGDTAEVGGNDTVYGGQGNDTIDYFYSYGTLLAYGNTGDDDIYGAAVDSTIYGGQGDDLIYGDDGDDVLYGNADDDLIYGAGGSNILYGGQGDDELNLIESDESVAYGNLGDDLIYASEDGSRLYGGQGNDLIYGDYGEDTIFANDGEDYIFFYSEEEQLPSGPQAQLNVANIDSLNGGAGSDTLDASLANLNEIYFTDFTADEDVLLIYGVTAEDLAANAYGGAIVDSNDRGNLLRGPHIDLIGSDGALVLVNAAGSRLDGDNLKLFDGSVFAYNVGGAAVTLAGGAGDDVLIAGDAGDTLVAAGGEDTLIGGDGDDHMIFALGYENDTVIDGGAGTDAVAVVTDASNSVQLFLEEIEAVTLRWGSGTGNATSSFHQESGVAVDASSLTVGQNISVDLGFVSRGSMVETGTGNDTLIGTEDTLTGDTLAGGDGNDTAVGGAGADRIDGQAGADIIVGDGGADTLIGGMGADTFDEYNAYGGFTLTTVDQITDFTSEDAIAFLGDAATVFDQRLTDFSTSVDLAAAASAAYTGADQVAAHDAVLFVYGGRTYAYVNDETAGFSTTTDLLVDITGFSGTLTAANFTGLDA